MPSRTYETEGLSASSNGMSASFPTLTLTEGTLASHSDFSLASRLGDALNGHIMPETSKRPTVEENSFGSSKRQCGARSYEDLKTHVPVTAFECVDAQTQTEPTTGKQFHQKI